MMNSFLGSEDGGDEKSSGIIGGGGGGSGTSPVSSGVCGSCELTGAGTVRPDIRADISDPNGILKACYGNDMLPETGDVADELKPGTTITGVYSDGRTTPVTCPCPAIKCCCPLHFGKTEIIPDCVYSAFDCEDVPWPGECKSPVYIGETSCLSDDILDIVKCEDIIIENEPFTICDNGDKKIGDDGKEYRRCTGRGLDRVKPCRIVDVIKITSKKISDSCGGKIQQLDKNTCIQSGCTYEITKEYLVDYDGHKAGEKVTREVTYGCDYKQAIN